MATETCISILTLKRKKIIQNQARICFEFAYATNQGDYKNTVKRFNRGYGMMHIS